MSWKATLTDGSALDEPAIRELWSFQLSLLRLKSQVQPEKDFEKFAADCRKGRRILRLRDGSGRLCGSVVPLVFEGSFQSERFRLVIPEYFYLAPELRGRAAVSWAWFRCLTPLLYPWGARVFVGGIGYPTGTLLLERLVGHVWLYGEPGIPPLAAHVLERIVAVLADNGWDAASGQADMSVLPARPGEEWLARMQRRALYRRYVARCLRWQEGWALPSVTEYTSWKVVKTALQVPRRWWTHHGR